MEALFQRLEYFLSVQQLAPIRLINPEVDLGPDLVDKSLPRLLL